MWNNNETNNDASGGFDSTANMFSSPAQGSSSKGSSKARALAPVAIRQILECSEDGLKIKEIDVQVVKVVGIIKKVEKSTIRVVYSIEDATGTIQGISYLETETETLEPMVEDIYCVIIGSIRCQSGSKHIMIFNIYPITDFYEIIEHYLAVMHMPLRAETMDLMTEPIPMKQEMMSSYGASGGIKREVNYLGMDQEYRKIYELITRNYTESGISTDEINTAMVGIMPSSQARSVLDYLLGEGYIFTTIDDNHFKSTESPF